MACSYGKFCCVIDSHMPQALCQAPVCSRSLHHVCQAEFEERHKALIGEVRVMNKRCLPCLLNQQQCDAATSARLILESNVSEAAVVTPARTRSATKGKLWDHELMSYGISCIHPDSL